MTTLAFNSIVFGGIIANRLWFSLPLVVSISLVYAATRHELMRPILDHALRFGVWVLAFMAVVFVVLTVVSSWL